MYASVCHQPLTQFLRVFIEKISIRLNIEKKIFTWTMPLFSILSSSWWSIDSRSSQFSTIHHQLKCECLIDCCELLFDVHCLCCVIVSNRFHSYLTYFSTISTLLWWIDVHLIKMHASPPSSSPQSEAHSTFRPRRRSQHHQIALEPTMKPESR